MGTLDGTNAIVTGAGRGIGRAEALLLASEGASVLVNDVDAAEAASVVDAVRAAGGTAEVNTDDIATWAGAEAAVGAAVDAYGRLDILVNNAGIIRDVMSFSMDEAQWDGVITVHLKGHAAMSHFAGAHWRGRAKAGEDGVWGRIINTASESGLYGLAGQINYATAKAGIASMTIVLGRELRKYGVTANAIAPRARTRMTETVLTGMEPAPGEFDEWDPDNVAPIVAWLARPESKDITGQVFVVNGDKVHLMEGWHRVGRVDNGGERWTIDRLDAASADLFGDRSTKLPPAGFGE